jgi:hypothetical protein
MSRSLARYLRSFTGFGRDARLFLLTTIVFGAALSLYWIDFNLYLESIGLDRPTIGWLLARFRSSRACWSRFPPARSPTGSAAAL